MATSEGWYEYAACKGGDTDAFFAPFDVETNKVVDEALVLIARTPCRDCPVRRACLEDITTMEQGHEVVYRAGVRGYLTPGQREAAEKRGILRCPRCDAVRDPVLLARGELRCPRRCGQPARHTSPLPMEGDQWTKRHTTLGQRITAWIVDNTRQGDVVPTPTRMSELLDVRRSDVLRVYGALVEDKTLQRDDQTYTRLARTGTLRTWHPKFLKQR